MNDFYLLNDSYKFDSLQILYIIWIFLAIIIILNKILLFYSIFAFIATNIFPIIFSSWDETQGQNSKSIVIILFIY